LAGQFVLLLSLLPLAPTNLQSDSSHHHHHHHHGCEVKTFTRWHDPFAMLKLWV
jgi:hypothetical protein